MSEDFFVVGCNVCGEGLPEPVVPLQATPIEDLFFDEHAAALKAQRFPMGVAQCGHCGHVQSKTVIESSLLFNSDYLFASRDSMALRAHFADYVDWLIEYNWLADGQTVFEIGANDGTFLDLLKARLPCLSVAGVDPASEVVSSSPCASAGQIRIDYFSSAFVFRNQFSGSFDCIFANNVLAHSYRLADIFLGIYDALKEGGRLVFEVSSLEAIVDRLLFDTCYHEHVSFHSLFNLEYIATKFGFTFAEVIENRSKGGSIRCVFVKGKHIQSDAVVHGIAREKRLGLHNGVALAEAAQRFEATMRDARERIAGFTGKVVAFGASPSSIALGFQLGVFHHADVILDNNVSKHGRFAANTGACVMDPMTYWSAHKSVHTLVVVLAWNFYDQILKSNPFLTKNGWGALNPMQGAK